MAPGARAVVSLEQDKTKLHITKQLMRLMRITKVRGPLTAARVLLESRQLELHWARGMRHEHGAAGGAACRRLLVPHTSDCFWWREVRSMRREVVP